ncbi:hypothetical+protein [Methylocapsa aurea]|uniref:N-6 DNA methylase n=1 Tax=Methylocapsa aurea TaxID=663610 RepID=UPI003D18A50F
MNSKTPTPAQIFSATGDAWRHTGANATAFVVPMCEMMAALKLAKSDGKHGVRFPSAELTLADWHALRHRTQEALALPAYDGRAAEIERWPGLMEQCRRIVEPITPLLLSKDAGPFVLDLVRDMARNRASVFMISWLLQWTPDFLEPLVSHLIKAAKPSDLYVPFESSGWLPLMLAARGHRVFSDIQNAEVAYLIQLLAFLGDWDLTVRVGDALHAPGFVDGERLRQFPASIAVLSFGLRLRDGGEFDHFGRFPIRLLYGEGRQIAHMLAQTKGVVLAVAPEGFLFRTAGGERDYKEMLVRSGVLRAVIRLPRDAFAPAASIQTSLLVLDNQPSGEREVTFIDASFDLGQKSRTKAGGQEAAVKQVVSLLSKKVRDASVAHVGYAEIAAQDFNISVDRYVRSDDELAVEQLISAANSVELGDIAEIMRPQSVGAETGGEGRTFAEVALGDIDTDGSIKEPAKVVTVDERSVGKVLRQTLQPGDVLLSIRGRIGAVAIVPGAAAAENGWLASQAFAVLRLRPTSPLSPVALHRFLASPIGQQLLKSLTTGTTVPMVSMGDVKKLKVLVPTAAELRRIEREAAAMADLRTQIRVLDAKLSAVVSTAWPMNDAMTALLPAVLTEAERVEERKGRRAR